MTMPTGGYPGQYPNFYPDYYPSATPIMPSHITHSWAPYSGIGGDPFAQLAAAMNRLASAIEKQNELAEPSNVKPDHQSDASTMETDIVS